MSFSPTFSSRFPTKEKNPPKIFAPQKGGEDIDQIMGFLQRLHSISLEILDVAIEIQYKHEFYSGFPRKIKSLTGTVERQINWLKEQRIHF